MIPRYVTWTGYRTIGKSAEETRKIYQAAKDLENAVAYAAELECVPHNLASFLSSQTRMILMSLGSGDGCFMQFLFSNDIPGDCDEGLPPTLQVIPRFPRGKTALEAETCRCFWYEYIADVKEGRFPERSHLVEMDEILLQELLCSIEKIMD